MNKKEKAKVFIIGLLPITIALNFIFKKYPRFVEKYYSTTVNKITRQVISKITGIFPFSVAEILFLLLILILILLVIKVLVSIAKGSPRKSIMNLFAYASILYVLFISLWGFNYDRLSFDKIAGLSIQNSSKEELYQLCKGLAARANELRIHINENEAGIMTLNGSNIDVFRRAQKGYDEASKFYSELGGSYGIPKRILLSEKLSYTGITGIYMPYTGEANVNTNITDFMLPATAAHEMAHQRGFAREDEANYIAYLTCTLNPDIDFQYSGTMLALIYSANALADVDFASYKELYKTYSEGVKRDLKYDYEFWQKYKGKTEEISNNINNSYLKTNGQKDGVQSYGRMVDLLLAQQRKKAIGN